MDFKQLSRKDVYWINLIQDINKRQILVALRIPKIKANFWLPELLLASQERVYYMELWIKLHSTQVFRFYLQDVWIDFSS
jgi:hypothetical protein